MAEALNDAEQELGVERVAQALQRRGSRTRASMSREQHDGNIAEPGP